MTDLEGLAQLIAADLRIADDESDEAVEARCRIAKEYQSLTADERAHLNALLGTAPAVLPKVSRESEQLMSDLKRREFVPLSPRPTPRARPIPSAISSQRSRKRAVDVVEYTSPIVRRYTLQSHPYLAHQWPYSNARWCQVCGEVEARHG